MFYFGICKMLFVFLLKHIQWVTSPNYINSVCCVRNFQFYFSDKPTNTMISHVNGSKISSGENANADDVLVCSTNSNPPARKYTWMTGDIVANEKTFTFPHSFNGFTSLQCSVKNYMGENRIIEGTDSVTIHVNVLGKVIFSVRSAVHFYYHYIYSYSEADASFSTDIVHANFCLSYSQPQ